MKQLLRFYYFLLLYKNYFLLVLVSQIPSGFNVYITPNMASKITSDSGTWTGRYCNYTSSCRSNFDRHIKLLQFNECKECKSMVTQSNENEEEVYCTDQYQTEMFKIYRD